MKNKKGALELSITLIVVIVIGVTLLVLGLVWVRGMFVKIESLTADAFETAEGQIGMLSGVDSLLTLSPRTISIKQGSAKTIDVIIANFESIDVRITAHVESPTEEKIECLFADTIPKGRTSKLYTLKSGEQVKITMVVDEKGGSVGTKNCVVTIPELAGEADNTAGLIINVEPK